MSKSGPNLRVEEGGGWGRGAIVFKYLLVFASFSSKPHFGAETLMNGSGQLRTLTSSPAGTDQGCKFRSKPGTGINTDFQGHSHTRLCITLGYPLL